jgi:gliding motility-associated-like protein
MQALLKYIKSISIVYIFFTNTLFSAYSQITVGFASVTSSQDIYVIAMNPYPLSVRTYIFYRANQNSNDYIEVGRKGINSFTDTNVEPDKYAYCYKVKYIEGTFTSQLSEPFCSILLSSNDSKSINWTPFEPLPQAQPVQYYINILSPNMYDVFITSSTSVNDISQISAIQNQLDAVDKVTLEIKAIQPTTFVSNGSSITNLPIDINSNPITIYNQPNVYLPTAFTPNGANPIFLAQGRNIAEFNMLVYNQWGNVVFESSNISTGWDGNLFDGTPCPIGNYAYKIVGKDTFNQAFAKAGTVMILR